MIGEVLTIGKVLGATVAYLAWTVLEDESKNLNKIMLMMFLSFLLGLLLTMSALLALKKKIKELEERAGQVEGRTQRLEDDTDNMAALLLEEVFIRS